jgi:hypothetical protein
MKGDRYTRAKNIVLGAESLPEPLRTPFIDRVCADDPMLRAEVTSLLAHRDATPPALEPGALDAILDAALREQTPAAAHAGEPPAAREGSAPPPSRAQHGLARLEGAEREAADLLQHFARRDDRHRQGLLSAWPAAAPPLAPRELPDHIGRGSATRGARECRC